MSSDLVRLKCPQCEARLAFSREQRSPYIRCGVCNVLIEFRTDSSTNQPVTFPPESGYGISTEQKTNTDRSPYGRSNFAPIPDSQLLRIDGPPRPSRRVLSPLFLFGILTVGLLIFLAILVSEQSDRRRGQAYRIKSWRKNMTMPQARPTPSRIEVNLNSGLQIELGQQTTGVAVDGRNWTQDEVNAIAALPLLRSISYTNVSVGRRDLAVLRRNLEELDLSQSSWRTSHLLFNAYYYPDLVKLDLSYSNVTGFAIANIGQCKKLIELNLRGTSITDEDLKALNNHTSLQLLDVSNTRVSHRSLRNLNLSRITEIKVSDGMLSTSQREEILLRNPGVTVLVLPNDK